MGDISGDYNVKTITDFPYLAIPQVESSIAWGSMGLRHPLIHLQSYIKSSILFIQAEAEVVPSSSLVEIEVEVELGVEVEVGVEVQLKCSYNKT